MEHPKYGSPADAQAWLSELTHQICNPDEDGLTEEQVKGLQAETREIRRFLAECDEGLCPLKSST